MHNIMLRKDIIIRATATIFLVLGTGIALKTGAFL